MPDSLSQALGEAPKARLTPAPDVVAEHTSHRRTVPDILSDVRDQAVAAFALPFFDGDGESSSEPVIKCGIAEAGTVHISAHRLDPPYRADLTLFVRSDRETTDDATYEVHGRCELSRGIADAATGRHEFAIGLTIGGDGLITLDVPQLRAELAQAIRDFA